MSLTESLSSRSSSTCELCSATESLAAFCVPPRTGSEPGDHALLCPACLAGQDPSAELDVHHWRCLTTSMWSEVPAVQVLAWRLLSRLAATESWARENLDMLYLEDDVRTWAEEGFEAADDTPAVVHKDANGAVLAAGDTVTLIKDLNVKGGGFTAKRGTAVRGIRLVEDNPAHIEGRVEGQEIVILTEFVKKAK